MILIKGGRLLDPKSGTDAVCDIQIENGTVCGIGSALADERAYERVIDAEGLVVAPGFVDGHVHFRDPGLTYKEDIRTGSAAAARGGYTTVICMANTKPPVDHPDTLSYILSEGKQTGINVLSCAVITKAMEGCELTDMRALMAAGAVGFTDDGKPIMDERLAAEAMREAKALGVPLSFHEEDPALIGNNGINAGVAEKLGLKGSPAAAEDVMVARDVMLAAYTGARVNIQHISSGHAVDLVKLGKKWGADVWAEVTPHHFTLTEDAVLKYGTLAKMNPPLRTEEDRQRIIRGIQEGAIDMIATDHAPHSVQEKEKPLTEAPSGIIGLETALALGVTELVKPGYIGLMDLVRLMSLGTARLYNLDKGYISVGADADLTIFSDRETWTVGAFASKASNSPFAGWKLTGKVKYTICGGRVVYEDQ